MGGKLGTIFARPDHEVVFSNALIFAHSASGKGLLPDAGVRITESSAPPRDRRKSPSLPNEPISTYRQSASWIRIRKSEGRSFYLLGAGKDVY
jgi:hypothetical protein